MKSIFNYMLFGLRSRLDKRSAEKARAKIREATVDEAIDHLVDGIDPKMRIVSG